MTLDEIFKKYPDDKVGFYRRSMLEKLKIHRPDEDPNVLLKSLHKSSVEWLKGLKKWGVEESRKMGFIIPDFMLDDAVADDWELYE